MARLSAMEKNARAAEQNELYRELLERLRKPVWRGEQYQKNIELVHSRNSSNKDQTALFRSFLSALSVDGELWHIERLHNALAQRGVQDVHRLINDQMLEQCEAIMDALLMHFIGAYEGTLPKPVADIIHYTVTSKDPESITIIVEERKPQSLAQLLKILSEMDKVAAPLQEGVL